MLLVVLNISSTPTVFPAPDLTGGNSIDFLLADTESTLLDEIDPDINCLPNPQSKSSYFSISQFNSLIASKSGTSKDDVLALLHCNIRSISANLSSLLAFTSALNFDFPIIGLSETWLNEDTAPFFQIPNFNSVNVHRTKRRGGGVSLLIRNTLRFKRRPDLDLMTDHCECVFAELLSLKEFRLKNHSPRVLIGTIYHPPNSNFDEFHESLRVILSVIQREGKTCYLMGDFNLHMVEHESNAQGQALLDLLHSNLFLPLIDKPTRVCSTSSSLIDNIFTNHVSGDLVNGVFHTDVSDHFPVFTLLFPETNLITQQTVKYRVFSERNKARFQSLLQDESWEAVLQQADIASAYSLFASKLNDIFQTSFPLHTKIPNLHRSCRKPWVTREIKILLRRKNKLFSIFRARPTLDNEIRYKSMKAQMRTILRNAEKDYYSNQLNEHRNNVKRTWDILNELIGKPKNKSVPPEIVTEQGTVSDTADIVEEFNNYFVEIGQRISSELPSDDTDAAESLSNRTIGNSMFFTPATEMEIEKCISRLKKGSAGHDQLRPDLLKENMISLLKPITQLVNMSLTEGKFPDQLKIALITPVHKGGADDCLNNYRPISVLTAISKVLERVVYNRLLSFLETNSILSNSQFGFRRNHSCELPLVLATEFIREALDEGEHVIAVFLDLRKAFDVVSHSVLLRKMECYGIRGVVKQWFTSYLTERKQAVKMDGEISHYKQIVCGVPQGSVLGPLLFLIFINDLKVTADYESCKYFLFADDTTVLVRSPDISSLVHKVNNQLSTMAQWFQVNRLSVNLNKTMYMFFTLHKHLYSSSLQITINGEEIKRTTSTRFLGVIIDDQLSWKNHVAHISSKLSKSVGIIGRVGKLIPHENRVNLYHSLLLPYFSYCHIVWGSAGSSFLKRLIVLQKKAIRAINLAPFRAHTQDMFYDNQILPVQSMNQYYSSIFLYKCMHEKLPHTFLSDFKLHLVRHPSPITRNQTVTKMSIPRCRTTFGQRRLMFTLSKLYNDFFLPLDLHELTFPCLKRHLKVLLL